MYTTSAPKLFENGSATELLIHGLVKTDERDGLFRIIVSFFKVKRENEPKLTLRFRFKISNGYWSLTSVEVEDSKKLEEFFLIGKSITAPLQFSYKCAQTLVFRSNSTAPSKLNLTLHNVQVFKGKIFFEMIDYNVFNLQGSTINEWIVTIRRCVRLCGLHNGAHMVGNIRNVVHISDHYVRITLHSRN